MLGAAGDGADDLLCKAGGAAGVDEGLDGLAGFGTLLTELLCAANDGGDESLGAGGPEADTSTLLAKVLNEAGGADAGTLLTKVLNEAGGADATTLLTKVLNATGAEADTGALLTGLLVTGALPAAVEGEGSAEMADDGEEGLSAAELKADAVGIGSAKAGVASASPQARMATELLR